MLVIKTDMTYTVTHQTTHILSPGGPQNALDKSHTKPPARQAARRTGVLDRCRRAKDKPRGQPRRVAPLLERRLAPERRSQPCSERVGQTSPPALTGWVSRPLFTTNLVPLASLEGLVAVVAPHPSPPPCAGYCSFPLPPSTQLGGGRCRVTVAVHIALARLPRRRLEEHGLGKPSRLIERGARIAGSH